MKRYIFLCLLAAALANCAPGSGARDSSPPPGGASAASALSMSLLADLRREGFIVPLKHESAPDFTLRDLTGRERNRRLFSGKLFLLNFWGVWCSACRLEMPSLQLLYDRFRHQGLEIIAVDEGDALAQVRDYIEKNAHTFPVLFDGDGRVGARYGVRNYPTTYLVDREGRIIARRVGALDWNADGFRNLMERLLAAL